MPMDLHEWAGRQLGVPTVAQKVSGMCGPAALRMAALAFGVDVPEAQLGELAGSSEEFGTSLQGLVQAAQAIGLDAEVHENASFDDIAAAIEAAQVPIVSWFSVDDGHYSVATGVDAGQLVLNDPETGSERRFTFEEFEPDWFDFDGPGRTLLKSHAFVSVRKR